MLTPFDRPAARAAMPHAFHAFLGPFGKLTAIQAEGMPAVLSGVNVVLVAPAASGKTETALAPLCERLVRDRPLGGAGILYIVPTRALANDIEVRATHPAKALGLDLVVRTGDRPAALKTRADVLVTTPESFDSLLCRRPELFDGLRAVVVDEAHLLDGTSRGDQMAVLLRRLRARLKPRAPQIIAMSATVADPAGLGLRLCGTPPLVVRAGALRPTRIQMADDVEGAVRWMRGQDLSKALVFCNTRRRVETVAEALARAGAWPPERVMVHHGSLSRREREDVEKAFHWWEAGLLVCTTTLEIGIDVGDVDAVVMVGAPESVAAFQQRVGRGCRRRAGMVAVCVPLDDGDRRAFDAIAQDLETGRMPATGRPPDLSVAVQQVFSILYASPRGVTRREMVTLLSPLGAPSVIGAILDHLVAEEHIETGNGGRLVATTWLMDFGERGRIHSNIADTRSVSVIDSATGRAIGQVSLVGENGQVTLGGRSWRVVGSGREGVSVVQGGPPSDGGTHFASHGSAGAFTKYLPGNMRR